MPYVDARKREPDAESPRCSSPRRLSAFASCYFLRLRSGSGGTLLAPTSLSALRTTLVELFLAGVELGALIRRQDGSDLRHFLISDRLTALHHLASLLHVAAKSSGVTLLSSRTRRIEERLRLRTKRLVLRLVFLPNCCDLSLLGVGQIQVTSEPKAFATTGAAAELTVRARPATVKTAVWTRGRSRRGLSGGDSRDSNDEQGAERQCTYCRHSKPPQHVDRRTRKYGGINV